MVKNKASMGILFRKIKHELEGLSLANGSLSRSHILVAGLLGAGIGAAGLVLGLKDIKMGNLQISWPSRCKCTSETTYYMAGLQNLGNNCFFNVVLQALASCGCFFSYLEDMLNTIDLEYKEVVEEVPLAAALVSLLNDLCITHEEAIVLNPRKVMVAMSLHLNNFILTRQQDAAEAFIHLMSSLQEELLECYTPCHGSLADITGFPGNVVSLISENSKDLRQWQKLRFGPFDGIIGSMLICANCSTQVVEEGSHGEESEETSWIMGINSIRRREPGGLMRRRLPFEKEERENYQRKSHAFLSFIFLKNDFTTNPLHLSHSILKNVVHIFRFQKN